MIDVIAPLALVAMALGVVALVVAARRQRAARRGVFQELATTAGRRYLETDDGTAQAAAEGFEGFGRFASPSLGAKPPEAVVVGGVDEGTIHHFLHGTRDVEGQAREWTVCLVEAPRDLCGGTSLRIVPTELSRVGRAGGPPVVSFAEDAAFAEGFEVRSPDPESARACLDPRVRQLLTSRGLRRPLPVEVQVRDRRLAVYLAGRNDEARGVEDLQALEDLARSLVAALLRSEG